MNCRFSSGLSDMVKGVDLGFKEKKEKTPSFFREPLKLVRRTLRPRTRNNKAPPEDPKQPPTEQKSPLLDKNHPSDEVPMSETHFSRTHPGPIPHYGESQIKTNPERAPHMLIKMKNGRMVDPEDFRALGGVEPSTSPSTSAWSPSHNSFQNGPYPRSVDRRPGYGQSPLHSSQLTTDQEYEEPRRPAETIQQTATYESLLREAQTLRRDLEKEHKLNSGSKKEVDQQIATTKIKIADVRTNNSEKMYDEIISALSQELTDLEKKVREIEARMHPLDRAIGDLRDVEDFIADRQLDSEGTALLFEEIMKKMFEDINVSQHVLSGEVPVGHLPRNVIEEMQTKLLTDSLNKSDPSHLETETEGGQWVEFGGDDYGLREKVTSADNQDAALRKKRNKDKLQRVSMKLTDITDFTKSRMKSPGRTEAFKFHALGRSDAVKDDTYMPPADLPPHSMFPIDSDGGTAIEEVRPLGAESWMGFNQGTGMTPAPSEVSGSLQASKSVADMQSLDQYPGLSSSPSLTEKDTVGIEAQTPVDLSENLPLEEDKDMKEKTMTTGTGTGNGTRTQTDSSKQPSEAAGDSTFKTDKDKKIPSGETPGSMSDQLAQVQLKKAGDRPETSTSTAPPIVQGADFARLTASLMANSAGEGEKKNVKLDLDVKEKPAPPPKPSTKPPPPSPKKAAPPPPPPPKKKAGPPPPPKGKKGGAKGGPPPPPSGRRKGGDVLQRAPEVIAMFQEMRKALLGNAAKGAGGPKKIGGDAAAADPAALMEELSKNSKYAAQVQQDIVQYGGMIGDLIQEVSSFDAVSMEEMIEFVKRVDTFLSELSDETAVLKQFEWPNRYYTMLEAKGLYEELEKMKHMFKSWKKTTKSRAEELKNIQKFMDKSKNRVDVILRTKDSDEKKFKDSKIPWNAKVFTEVKIASLSLLIFYMDVVLEEVNALMTAAPVNPSPTRSKAHEKSMGHLTGAINFAFKAHQFAGGFTEACNVKFAEIASKTRDLKTEIADTAS